MRIWTSANILGLKVLRLLNKFVNEFMQLFYDSLSISESAFVAENFHELLDVHYDTTMIAGTDHGVQSSSTCIQTTIQIRRALVFFVSAPKVKSTYHA